MTNQRTADLLIGAFKDEMTARRKYELKDSSGKVLTVLYFPPLASTLSLTTDSATNKKSLYYILP